MQIVDTFDVDTSSDWQFYTNVYSAEKSVKDGVLDVRMQNRGDWLALMSPYILSDDYSIEIDIQCLYGDRFGSVIGYAGGIWLYNANKNNWVRFTFERYEINVYSMTNANPQNQVNMVLLGKLDVFLAEGGGFHKLKIEKSDTKTSFYVDGQLIIAVDIGFVVTGFALLCKNGAMNFDNLILNTDATALYCVGGTSVQDDGKASRFVLINYWDDGKFIAKVTPSADGSWNYMVASANPVLITHVGEDGFRPQADGGVIPILV